MITYKIEFSYFEGDEKKSEFVIIVRADNKEKAIEKACSIFESADFG